VGIIVVEAIPATHPAGVGEVVGFWCKISIGYKIWEAQEAFPTLYGSHFQLLNLFAPEPCKGGEGDV
jgi:hypothetical protein